MIDDGEKTTTSSPLTQTTSQEEAIVLDAYSTVQ